MNKRKIIVLDHLPEHFRLPKRLMLKKEPEKVPSPTKNPFLVEDCSGTLLVDTWKSAWKYRNNHVRINESRNISFEVCTTFVNARAAALMLGATGYFSIHRAIISDTPIRGCYLEYTVQKNVRENTVNPTMQNLN